MTAAAMASRVVLPPPEFTVTPRPRDASITPATAASTATVMNNTSLS